MNERLAQLKKTEKTVNERLAQLDRTEKRVNDRLAQLDTTAKTVHERLAELENEIESGRCDLDRQRCYLRDFHSLLHPWVTASQKRMNEIEAMCTHGAKRQR